MIETSLQLKGVSNALLCNYPLTTNKEVRRRARFFKGQKLSYSVHSLIDPDVKPDKEYLPVQTFKYDVLRISVWTFWILNPQPDCAAILDRYAGQLLMRVRQTPTAVRMWFLTENTEHGLFPPSIPGVNMGPLKLRFANGFPTLTAKGKKNDSE